MVMPCIVSLHAASSKAQEHVSLFTKKGTHRLPATRQIEEAVIPAAAAQSARMVEIEAVHVLAAIREEALVYAGYRSV